MAACHCCNGLQQGPYMSDTLSAYEISHYMSIGATAGYVLTQQDGSDNLYRTVNTNRNNS